MKFLIYLSLIFLFSELFIAFRKYNFKTEKSIKKDRYSLLFFWIIIPVSITMAFMTAYHETWQKQEIIIALTGSLIAFAGLIIRWFAIYQLQQQFTVNVSIVDKHQLVTGKLYKYVRHPAYLGLWIFAFGLGLAMNSFVSWLILITAFSISIYYRIYVEEQLLEKIFGQKYTKYKKTTPKLFPIK